MPIQDPNYSKVGIVFENAILARLHAIAQPEHDIPRTASYRLINALLELSLSQISENEILGLETWEVLALINFFQQTKFKTLDPDLFWRKIRDFNEALGQKVGELPRTTRLQLLLKILYERKNNQAE